jgi:hypothetical protein
MFEGRNLVIATKHEKEIVIAPIIENELGVKCFVVPNLDTDQLGTFTGEIERVHDPIATARNKCFMAMELTNCDLAIASEGSFGPHPSIYFLPSDDEFLVFIDRKNGLEIVARELSVETNFNGAVITNESMLFEFAKKAKFPSHGLILRKSKDEFNDIKKGITNSIVLHEVFNYFISTFETAYIETDMRAMYNPTRMRVIENATKKLIEKIKSKCPECAMPGFVVTAVNQGLPCEICNNPTKSTLSYQYSCQKCSFTKEEKYPKGKKTEDPMYCDICNP